MMPFLMSLCVSRPSQHRQAIADGIVGDAPGPRGAGERTALVDPDAEYVFQGAHHAAVIVPTQSQRAVTPPEYLLHVGVVKQGHRPPAQVRKPGVHLGARVIIHVTRVHEQHIDQWLEAALLAPAPKPPPQAHVVLPYPVPALVALHG